MRKILSICAIMVLLTGCKYYGSALPPEYPISMDDALSVARDNPHGVDGARANLIPKPVQPLVDRPSYVPEKELAVVAPPKTLLVWTYPHVTDDNTRVFGNWATIFLKERYEWLPPANEIPADNAHYYRQSNGIQR